MNAALQIAIAVASVAVLLGLMVVVRHYAARWGLNAEVQRKLVHIGTGLYAMTLPWLFWDRWPVFMLVGLTLAVMVVLRLPRFAKGGIGETLHGVERQSYGDILLALAVGTVFLLSNGNALLYILPIAILTLADAAAALTGSHYGRRFFTIEEGQKSIEGSVAFFLIALIASMVCLLLLSDVGRGNVILLALIVAAFGTLVEADSWRGFDNFFLPAGIMVFLESHMNSPPATLLVIMALFALAILVFLAAAPRLGLTKHAARVYVISAFMLLSVTALQNTVLPLLVFVAHALSRRTNPCKAAYPELDIVAALALASFAWLSVGLLTGLNALGFYAVHAVGLSVGLTVLAMRSHVAQMAAGLATALVLLIVYMWLIPRNGVVIAWAGDMQMICVAGALVALGAAILGRGLFADHRAARMTLVTGAVPAATYAYQVYLAGAV
ncbi:hypothetical protein [Yoonia sp. 208BN28-4]|uniref:hypothetical protein n=1 Tax=Yoonia sp. 208BN28-4 TaxID=3126505 RepID=UPI00309DEB52